MANSSGVVGVLRALLTADTAAFDTSMRKSAAVVETTATAMSGLGKELTSLTPQAERMVKAFSGDRLLATANNLVAAVTKVGGANRLTEAEQARVNRTVTDAIAKYQALGQVAPKTMIDLADATKSVSEKGSGIFGFLEEMGHSFVARVTEGILLRDAIREVISTGKQAFEDAAQFENLSRATGVSVQALQQFAFVGQEFGLGTEDIARGIETLQSRLATGDNSAVAAVEKLGFKIQDLLKLNPVEMFLQLAEATGRVTDQNQKSGLAAQLFGERIGKTLLPMLGEIRTKMDEAAHSTAIMDDETIHAAHDFEVWWSRALMAAKAWTAEGVVGIVGGIKKIDEALGASMMQEAGFMPGVPAAPKGGEAASGTKSTASQQAITNADLLRNRLMALRNDAVAPLTAAQKASTIELEKYGVSQKEIAELIGTTEIAVHNFIDAHKLEEAEAKRAAEAELTERKRVIALYGEQYDTLEHALTGVRFSVQFLTAAQKEEIRSGLDAGDSVEDITKALNKQYPALHLGTLAVKMYGDALKELDAVRTDVFSVDEKSLANFRSVLDAEAAAAAQIGQDEIKQKEQVGTITAAIAERRAKFEVDAAIRAGASWQETYALERHLSELTLQATLASISQEVDARAQAVQAIQEAMAAAKAAGFEATPAEEQRLAKAQADLENQQQTARLRTQQAVEAFTLGELEKQDAIRRTQNVWIRAWDQMRTTSTDVIASIATGLTKIEKDTVGNLGTILFGFGHDLDGSLHQAAETAKQEYLKIQRSGKATAEELTLAFKRWHEAEDKANYVFSQRMLDVWRSIKKDVQDVLNDILKFFVETFIKGLTEGMAGAKLGQQFGRFLGGAGGGGGGGGLMQMAGAAALPSLFGGGGGVGAAAAVGGVESSIFAGSGVSAGFLAGAPALGSTEAGVVAGSSAVPGGAAAGGGLGFLTSAGFWTNPWTIGVGAGILVGTLLYRHFHQGGRGNDKRDQFLAQFAANDLGKFDANNPPGFYGLSRLLTKYKHPEMFDALIHAKAPSDVKRAEEPIAALFGSMGRQIKLFNMGGFVPPGVVQPAILHGGAFGEDIMPRGGAGAAASTFVNHWHISAIDADGVQRLVRSRDFVYEVRSIIKTNQHGIGSTIRRATGGTD